jgi:hypothetical protein
MPATKDNTTFPKWWKRANEELAKVGCRQALYAEASDAYEMGESPTTFAGYVQFNDDWKAVST